MNRHGDMSVFVIIKGFDKALAKDEVYYAGLCKIKMNENCNNNQIT